VGVVAGVEGCPADAPPPPEDAVRPDDVLCDPVFDDPDPPDDVEDFDEDDFEEPEELDPPLDDPPDDPTPGYAANTSATYVCPFFVAHPTPSDVNDVLRMLARCPADAMNAWWSVLALPVVVNPTFSPHADQPPRICAGVDGLWASWSVAAMWFAHACATPVSDPS